MDHSFADYSEFVGRYPEAARKMKEYQNKARKVKLSSINKQANFVEDDYSDAILFTKDDDDDEDIAYCATCTDEAAIMKSTDWIIDGGVTNYMIFQREIFDSF